MAKRPKSRNITQYESAANLGFEDRLCKVAEKLRHTLLPKLLSDELEVPEVEAVVEEVVS